MTASCASGDAPATASTATASTTMSTVAGSGRSWGSKRVSAPWVEGRSRREGRNFLRNTLKPLTKGREVPRVRDRSGPHNCELATGSPRRSVWEGRGEGFPVSRARQGQSPSNLGDQPEGGKRCCPLRGWDREPFSRSKVNAPNPSGLVRFCVDRSSTSTYREFVTTEASGSVDQFLLFRIPPSRPFPP